MTQAAIQIAHDGALLEATVSTDIVPIGGKPPVYILNTTPSPSGGGGTPTTVQPSQKTSTDKSGTITSGGTAQTAIAANANRRGWFLSNFSNSLMTVTDDGTAATAANGAFVGGGMTVDDGGNPTTAAISVFCATTGAAYGAKEYT